MGAVEKTVLIVESDVSLGDVLELYFEKHGATTVIRPDAGSGFEYFVNGTVDLLIVDADLPAGDGLVLCARIREASGIPVIVVSARADEDEATKAAEAGADCYVTKPFSPAELVRLADSLLRPSVRRPPGRPEAASFRPRGAPRRV